MLGRRNRDAGPRTRWAAQGAVRPCSTIHAVRPRSSSRQPRAPSAASRANTVTQSRVRHAGTTPVVGTSPIVGLTPTIPVQRGGHPARSCRVGAERDVDDARARRPRRSGARPSRDARRVPRAAHGAERACACPRVPLRTGRGWSCRSRRLRHPRSRATAGASKFGRNANARDPAVVSKPATSILSFTATTLPRERQPPHHSGHGDRSRRLRSAPPTHRAAESTPRAGRPRRGARMHASPGRRRSHLPRDDVRANRCAMLDGKRGGGTRDREPCAVRSLQVCR